MRRQPCGVNDIIKPFEKLFLLLWCLWSQNKQSRIYLSDKKTALWGKWYNKAYWKLVFIIVVFIKSKLTKSYIFKRWDDSPVG